MLKNISAQVSLAFVISIIILGFFAAYEFAILFEKVAPNETLSGILNNLVMLVAGFWLGSSNSSQKKDAVIAASMPTEVIVPASTGPQNKPLAALGVLGAITLAAALVFGSGGQSWAASCATPNLGTSQGVAEALVKLGYLQAGTIQPDALSSALRVFQGQKGLGQDGVAGSKTQAALGDAYCGATPSTGSLEGQFVNDLAAAITVAQAPPTLTSEVTCFTAIHDHLQATANLPAGSGLFTAYVVLIRKQAVLNDLQTDACLAVCGRAQQTVALPLISRIVPVNLIPNVCQLARLFTP